MHVKLRPICTQDQCKPVYKSVQKCTKVYKSVQKCAKVYKSVQKHCYIYLGSLSGPDGLDGEGGARVQQDQGN